jgi:transcriptional regulator of arginine metabolism
MRKASRKQEVKKLISTRKISSQEELVEILNEMGYETTQATLSRDLKEIGVARIPDSEKGHIYVLPQDIGMIDKIGSKLNLPGESITFIEFSYNFGIIKTYPGYASSVAIFIDSSKVDEIAGTIAGDDTILVIPREPASKKELKAALDKLFPNMQV